MNSDVLMNTGKAEHVPAIKQSLSVQCVQAKLVASV